MMPNGSPLIETYRKLYGNESAIRHEARLEIMSEWAEKIMKLSSVAFERYMEGDKDTADGRLYLDTMKSMREMLGIDAPAKVALTDPTGENEYEGISDKELAKRFAKIQSDMNVGEDTDA